MGRFSGSREDQSLHYLREREVAGRWTRDRLIELLSQSYQRRMLHATDSAVNHVINFAERVVGSAADRPRSNLSHLFFPPNHPKGMAEVLKVEEVLM